MSAKCSRRKLPTSSSKKNIYPYFNFNCFAELNKLVSDFINVSLACTLDGEMQETP